MLTSQCLPSVYRRLLFWPDRHHGGAGSTDKVRETGKGESIDIAMYEVMCVWASTS